MLSELLQRDADLRDGWRDVARKLAPYPTFDTAEGPVLTDAFAMSIRFGWSTISSQALPPHCWRTKSISIRQRSRRN